MPHETTRLRLPDGGAARLFTLSGVPGFAWRVVVATAPEQARLENLTRRGGLSAMLTHAEGVAWPDWRGMKWETISRTACGWPVIAARTCSGRVQFDACTAPAGGRLAC